MSLVLMAVWCQLPYAAVEQHLIHAGIVQTNLAIGNTRTYGSYGCDGMVLRGLALILGRAVRFSQCGARSQSVDITTLRRRVFWVRHINRIGRLIYMRLVRRSPAVKPNVRTGWIESLYRAGRVRAMCERGLAVAMATISLNHSSDPVTRAPARRLMRTPWIRLELASL